MRPLSHLFLYALFASLFVGCRSPATPIVLRSGDSTAVVAPAFGGRVMEFHPGGLPNVLWTCPLEDTNLSGWPNHGGEKTWIGPQSVWKEMSPSGWPPPAFFDAAAYTVTASSSNSVTLLSPMDREWRLRVERTITLTGNELEIVSRIIAPKGKPPISPSELLAWSVVQVPYSYKTAVYPVEPGRVENGVDNAKPLPEPELRDGLLHLNLPEPCISGKVGFDASAFVSETPNGTLVVSHLSPLPADTPPESRPLPASFYAGAHGKPETAPPELRYVELEFMTPADRPHAISLTFVPRGADATAEPSPRLP